MASYTVKPGDTLSRIGAQYGVPYSQITGYRSGNPNLIYPGEILNIPDRSAPPPTSTIQPSYSAPQSSSPQPQPTYAPVQSPGFGTTPEGVPISSLPPDLVWNGQLDISNPVKKAKYDQIVQQNQVASPGVPNFNQNRPAAPNFQNIYDTALTQATAGIQPQIDAINSQIATKTDAYNAQVSKIKDNPYLSEATMTGRLSKLAEKFNADIGLETKKQAIAEGKLSQARADAQVKLNIAAQQYNIESQEYQQNLTMFSNLLSSGALENASGTDIAQITSSTGLSSSMVQSIINFQKKKNEPTPSLQTFDDGSNQYVVAIDSLGNVINKQVIGQSKPVKETRTGTSADSKQEAAFDKAIADGIAQLQRGEDWGTVWNRIKAKFPDVPDILIDMGLGTSWREYGAFQSFKVKQKGPQNFQKAEDNLEIL